MKYTNLLLSLLFILAGNAAADTRYVSDMLEITMRSGKGTSYGITRMLRSADPATGAIRGCDPLLRQADTPARTNYSCY